MGIKIYGNQAIKSGNIIVRQRGSYFRSGDGTMMGKDYTIFAVKEGKVNFRQLSGKKIVEVE